MTGERRSGMSASVDTDVTIRRFQVLWSEYCYSWLVIYLGPLLKWRSDGCSPDVIKEAREVYKSSFAKA